MGKKINKIKKRFVDIFSGDFVLRKGLERNMGFVFYIFVIFCASICWSLYVEDTLVKVERNSKTIESLEIHYRQISVDLVGLDQRTRIEKMLEQCHSTLKAPEHPAKIISTQKQ